MKRILVLALLLLIGVFGVSYFMLTARGKLEKDTNIVVARGSSVRAVAKDMSEAGVIDQPLLFRIAARLKGIDRALKAGEYVFPANTTMLEVLNKLERGEVFYRKITLAEGLTNEQFFDIINAEPNLSGDITLKLKEGEMLAETYMFSKGDTRDSIVSQAKVALEKALDDAWKAKKDTLLKNKNEVLTLASIIEKETAIKSERRVVASVFTNRLRIGMALQTDPTVVYALTQGKGYLGRSLKREDMKIDSPYNTYLYPGLPPTPICNVGADSINAALNPEDTKYLYFVADGNGGHSFSETYASHLLNINLWLKKLRSF